MNILSTEGRIGRGTYFLWLLALSVLAAIPFTIFSASLVLEGEEAVGLIIAGVLLIFPAVKRLHDLNLSGWFLLLGLIPVVNIFLGLSLLLVKGTEGENKYDEPPGGSGRRATSTQYEDAFYEEAAKELDEGEIRPGLWARAFADADGDENRAKAAYIKLRVTELLEVDYPIRKRREKDERLVGEKGMSKYRLHQINLMTIFCLIIGVISLPITAALMESSRRGAAISLSFSILFFALPHMMYKRLREADRRIKASSQATTKLYSEELK